MLLKRSASEIIRDASIILSENTPITNFSPGSIARSMVEAIAPEIGTNSDEARTSLYDIAQEVLDQGALSKAKDDNLDLIGGLFSYPRRVEEIRNEEGNLVRQPIDDDMYRYEISQVVPSMATGNYAALRLALLTIVGVRDLIPKEYSHGTGSFSFVILTEYGFNEEEVLASVRQAIDKTKSFGVKPHVQTPVKVPVDLEIQLIFHETTSPAERENIRMETVSSIEEYIGFHELGKGLIYNDLVQQVMNVDESILDFEILSFSVNNELALLTNQDILDDEQLYPQHIHVI